MKKKLLILFLLVNANAIAQRTNRHTPVIKKGLYLSFNPHALFEAEQGAASLGLGYRINKRIEIWAEASYLYKGFFQDPEKFRDLKGIRVIVSGKYFYQNKYGFFAGAEFRIKQYSFIDKNQFVNDLLNDTLVNYQYTAQHTLIGGAIFWGKRFKITANGKFELEGNIGVGVKQRYIARKNVPAGYYKREYYFRDRISPIPDRDIDQVLPYFPATVRFIYHL